MLLSQAPHPGSGAGSSGAMGILKEVAPRFLASFRVHCNAASAARGSFPSPFEVQISDSALGKANP